MILVKFKLFNVCELKTRDTRKKEECSYVRKRTIIFFVVVVFHTFVNKRDENNNRQMYMKHKH